MFQHPSDFAILAFRQRHFDPAIAARAAFQIGVDLAIFHALNLDTVNEILKLFLTDITKATGAVGAFNTGRW